MIKKPFFLFVLLILFKSMNGTSTQDCGRMLLSDEPCDDGVMFCRADNGTYFKVNYDLRSPLRRNFRELLKDIWGMTTYNYYHDKIYEFHELAGAYVTFNIYCKVYLETPTFDNYLSFLKSRYVPSVYLSINSTRALSIEVYNKVVLAHHLEDFGACRTQYQNFLYFSKLCRDSSSCSTASNGHIFSSSWKEVIVDENIDNLMRIEWRKLLGSLKTVSKLEVLNGKCVRFKTFGSKFLSVGSSGISQKTTIDGTSNFTLSSYGGGVFSIKGSNGKYVRASSDLSTISVPSSTVGSQEKFYFLEVMGGRYEIISNFNYYLTISSSSTVVSQTKTSKSDSEFQILTC